MKRFASIVLILLVSACTPYAQRVAKYCTDLGMPPGSPHYIDCLQMAQHEQDRQAAAGAAMLGASTKLLSPAPSYYVVPRY